MHGPLLAHMILAVSALGAGDLTPAAPGQRLADARQALATDQPTAAIRTLEQALADPDLAGRPADKAAVLELLRRSYEGAARQALGAGRIAEADSYREDARILGRKSGSTPAANRARPAQPSDQADHPAAPAAQPPPALAEPPTPGPEPMPEVAVPAGPIALAAEPLEAAAGPDANANANTDHPVATPAPERLPEIRTGTPATAVDAAGPAVPGLREADAAFVTKNYVEAGRIYGALAREDRLPADRAEHWAYCRTCVVAQRINAHPRTDAEWREIQLETDRIYKLAPANYLATYVRNFVADQIATRSKRSRTNSTVVRAASPEEPPVRSPRATRSPSPTAAAAAAAAPNPAAPSGPGAIRVDAPLLTEPAAPPGGPVGRWRLLESANFRIYHANPELAQKVVQVAESVRREGIKRWSGAGPVADWQPRCEIYLFPNAPQYAQVTGQPADSPGYSTMGMNQGQIISRRVNVRTDHEGMLSAVLPHEITHVILADFFTDEQIPRWADEGMAVMMEPGHEQKRRAGDLVEPLGRNLLFPIETLMKMDYPDERYWNLYYAQSVSLTRFLVERGSPSQFVQFLQGAQARGFEAELKRVYKIENFTDLQAQWVTYARTNIEAESTSAPATAANEARPNRRAR